MTDLMCWMYEHYIRPQIESQPKNFGEGMLLDLFDSCLDPEQRQRLEELTAWYTVQGFKLGLRTGAALTSELQ